MEMTRERYQSAQEEKKQLTLKAEELERLEILGSLILLTFPYSIVLFFMELEYLQSCLNAPLASRILHTCFISQGSLISNCP